MNVNVEHLSTVKKKINFEIPADRVNSEIKKVYDEIRKTASIKGFRKGKVPQPVIEKYFSSKMAGEVLQNLVSETYLKALNDEKIVPVAPPTIDSDQVVKGEALKYSATVEIMPEIEVNDYIGLSVQKDPCSPNEEEVNKRLGEMQKHMAQVKPLDEPRPAALGDIVTLDFTGYLDGAPFDNGSAVDYMLELGSNSFIQGFEEQLVGMSVGDQGDIKVTFPKEYPVQNLAGKEVTFSVKINDIKEKDIPLLDDDFAKQFGEFDTLTQLKEKIAESYMDQEKKKIDNKLKDDLVRALIEKNPLEVPEALIEKQLQFSVDNIKNNLAAQHMTLEAVGTDEEKLRSEYRETATLQVKGTLLLETIAKKENITATEDDIQKKILDIAEKANKDSATVENFYQKNSYAREALIKQITEEKTIDFLMEKASITEVTPDSCK